MIWVYGRPFERLLEGGPGDDSLTGGAGADLFLGGPGFDTLVGGPGLDIVDYSGSPRGVGVLLRLTYHASDEGSHAWGDRYQGIEGAIGSRFRDSLYADGPGRSEPGSLLFGMDGDDYVYGAGGSDTLFGGSGDDRLEGRDSDDRLHAGGGTNELFGDGGNDFLDARGWPYRDYLLGGEKVDADWIAAKRMTSDCLSGGPATTRSGADTARTAYWAIAEMTCCTASTARTRSTAASAATRCSVATGLTLSRLVKATIPSWRATGSTGWKATRATM